MKIKHFIFIISIILFFNIFSYSTFAMDTLDSDDSQVENFAVPQNLRVTDKNIDTISLAWDGVEDVFYYEIYRGTSENGEFEYVGKSYFSSYDDEDFSPNQTYYYKVLAYSYDSNQSEYSNIVSASITFKAPQKLKVSSKGLDYVTLSWDEVEDAYSYIIYRATSKDGTYAVYDTTSDNSYFDWEVASNKTYYYKVQAASFHDKESDFSNIVSATTSLEVPQNLKVSSKTDTNIKLTWKEVDDADGYEVLVSTSKNGTYKKIATVDSNSYIHKNLSPNTYYYKVRAYNESYDYVNSYSSYSNITNTNLALKAPTNSKVSGKAPTSLTLSWNKVNHAEGYEIWMSTTKNGKYKKVGTTTKTSFTHSKLTINKTYYYKVRSYTNNKTNFSSYGNVISGKTVISTPTKFKLSNKTYNSLTLSWGKVTGVTGYEIWRSTSSKGKYTKISTTKTNSYKNTKLTPNKTYYYKVRSYVTINNKKYYSTYTTLVNGKPIIAAPSSLKTTGTNSSVKLTWKAVSGTSYKVYRSTTKNGSYKLIKTTNSNSYTDTNVTKGKSYYYKVVASKTINKKTYKSASSAIVKGTAKKVYAKPTFTVETVSETWEDTVAVGFGITNKGSKSLKILSDGYLIDDDYDSFNRELHLVNSKTGANIKSLEISKNATKLVAFRVIGDDTWYDQDSMIVFYFTYDGKNYIGYASNTYGIYYEPKK